MVFSFEDLPSWKDAGKEESPEDGPSPPSGEILSPRKKATHGGPTGRPRGRPKKLTAEGLIEHAKAVRKRSKTGCATCRQRKKKCDEGRPGCYNCKRNHTACGGYELPKIVISKDKNVSRPSARISPASSSEHALIEEQEHILVEHFTASIDPLFILSQGTGPMFKTLSSIEEGQEGVGYCLLALSQYHLTRTRPGFPGLERWEIDYHGHSLSYLMRHLDRLGGDPARLDEAAAVQIYLICLTTLLSGGKHGPPGSHMNTLSLFFSQRATCSSSAVGDTLALFVTVSLMSSRMVDGFLTTDDPMVRHSTHNRLLSFLRALLPILQKITQARHAIRCGRQSPSPTFPGPSMYLLNVLDDLLQSQRCGIFGLEKSDLVIGQLYHHAVKTYLLHTFAQSSSDQRVKDSVSSALDCFRALDSDASIQHLPLFIIGCAAREGFRRQQVNDLYDRLSKRRGEDYVKGPRSVVDRVWELVDRDDPRGWDWETEAKVLGLEDLLVV